MLPDFYFSTFHSEVTSATRTPAQKGVRKGAPLFSRIFAGREESSRQMQDFKRRRKGHVTGEKELYRVQTVMELETAETAACSKAGAVPNIANNAPPSFSFEILHLSVGRGFPIGYAQKTAPFCSTFRGERGRGFGDLE